MDINALEVTETFGFRSIPSTAKDGKMLSERAKFDAAGQKYEVTSRTVEDAGYDAETPANNVLAIKRNPVNATFKRMPVLELCEHKLEFVQQIIDDLAAQFVKKTFVDECLAIDNDRITAEALIEFKASKRDIAITPEMLKGVLKIAQAGLIALKIPEAHQTIILAIVKGRFGKQVLTQYKRYEDQYPALLARVTSCFSEEQFGIYQQALDAFQRNLDTFIEGEDTDPESLLLG